MNKIDQIFKKVSRPVLSIYITAGFPEKDSLYSILPALEESGVDFVEVGIPFSDPMADGEVIQRSSQQALKNGMSLKLLFEQLKDIRPNIPIILMGYFNPVYQFGLDSFISACVSAGVSGTIIPDLPPALFEAYRTKFESNKLSNVFLVTPQTSPERIQELAQKTGGFLYAVSTASVTGNKSVGDANTAYLSNLRKYAHPSPVMIGFGIKTAKDFAEVAKHADGGIIGSQFIRHLENDFLTNATELKESIRKFVNDIRNTTEIEL